MDWAALQNAARRGMQVGKPLQEPLILLRVAIGMLVATIVGYILHDPETQLLITVGAFLATIAAVMPHNRSRMVATTATCAAQIAAAALGTLLAGRWTIALPVMFVLFLVSGLLRAVAVSLSLRLTVITVVFLAFAEISSALKIGAVEAIGFFSLGFAITVLAQLLPVWAEALGAASCRRCPVPSTRRRARARRRPAGGRTQSGAPAASPTPRTRPTRAARFTRRRGRPTAAGSRRPDRRRGGTLARGRRYAADRDRRRSHTAPHRTHPRRRLMAP